jgi:hypothetical protein
VTLISKPNPDESREAEGGGQSVAELDAKHKEIWQDIRAGFGARKHFARELDWMTSSPSMSQAGAPTQAEADEVVRQEMQLLECVRSHAAEHLRGQQLTITQAMLNGEGTGWFFETSDGMGHRWELQVSYDTALQVAGQDESRAVAALIDAVVTRAIEARRLFFERVQAVTVGRMQ